MSHNRHPNFDLCDVLVRLKDGAISTTDLEYQPKIAWREDVYPVNARPWRTKWCPICWKTKPIVEFLNDNPLARTIIRGESAFVVADINEYCHQCLTGEPDA